MIKTYSVYKLVTGDEVVAEMITAPDGVKLLNPRVISVTLDADSNFVIELGPYSLFMPVIDLFSRSHILSTCLAPQQLIDIYLNSVPKSPDTASFEHNHAQATIH